MNNLQKLKKPNINKINNIISIKDFEKSPLKTQRINSPYSILSLRQSGITQEELYPISLFEYLDKYPNTKKLPFKIQESRFTFFENHRLKKIKYLKELRNQIQFENKSSRNKSDIHNKKNNNFYSEEISYILIEDLKSFERFKNRNDKELLDLIENEVNKTIFKNNYEKKIKNQKERFKEYKKKLLERSLEEQKKKLEIEKEKIRKQKEEEYLKDKLDREREEKNKIEYKTRLENEKLKEKEMNDKNIDEIKKRKEIQERINKQIEENKKKIEKRKDELAKKEKNRLVIMDLQRELKLLNKKEENEIKKKKIEKIQEHLKNKLNQIREEYLIKEKHNEEVKKKFEEQKYKLFKQKSADSFEKKLKIRKIIENQELLDQKKIEEFNEKQKQINEKKKLMDKKQQIEINIRKKEYIRKFNNLKHRLKNNEIEFNEKKNQIMKKLEYKDKLIKKILKQKKIESMNKIEEENKKKFINEDNLRRLNNIQDYEKEKILELIEEKHKKAEEIKNKKELLKKEKKNIQKQIINEKNNFFQRLKNIFSKPNINYKTLESFRETFINISRFDNLFELLKNNKGNKKYIKYNHSIYNINNSTDRSNCLTGFSNYKSYYHSRRANSTNNIFLKGNYSTLSSNFNNKNNLDKIYNINENENDIKINNYKLKLNKELMNVIEIEEKNEMERKNLIHNINDAEIKKSLSKQFLEERNLATKKIRDLSISNEKKIEEFIKQLENNQIK